MILLSKYYQKTINMMTALMLFSISLMIPIAYSSGDIEAGKSKAILCSACHGQDGNSINPDWPSLAGQHEKYLTNALTAYKNGTRNNAVMSPLAMSLSEKDIENIAAFYNSLSMSKKDFDLTLAKKGEALYRGGNKKGVAACIACHGPTGKGNPGAGYPAIAGQHAQYTKLALIEYTNGNRQPIMNDMMQTIALRLSQEEMEALSEYIKAMGSN
jgi:cytochrome c553